MSEELNREEEVRLVTLFQDGDQNATARLVAVGTMILLAEAAQTERHRPLQWEDANQQVICDLLDAPARVLEHFNPSRVRLRSFLLGRVRGLVATLRRADRRCHLRERSAFRKRIAPSTGRQINWEELAAQLWPYLTPGQRAYLQRALDALAARRREGIGEDDETISANETDGRPTSEAVRQIQVRIRRLAVRILHIQPPSGQKNGD